MRTPTTTLRLTTTRSDHFRDATKMITALGESRGLF
nr:MAG TPA: hypothetical protein [Caudoviricetes sp.]